jgi:hypothetical protein
MFVLLGDQSLRWSFSLGWSLDPDGMYCMLVLFQVMNPARHYHYCYQRSEVLRVSPRALLGHLP